MGGYEECRSVRDTVSGYDIKFTTYPLLMECMNFDIHNCPLHTKVIPTPAPNGVDAAQSPQHCAHLHPSPYYEMGQDLWIYRTCRIETKTTEG